MPDFIATFTNGGDAAIEDRPPALHTGILDWARWPWGWLGIDNRLWRPLACPGEDATFLVAGRPTRRGSSSLDAKQVSRALGGDRDAYAAISGMFLLMRASQSGLVVATDRFSHMPVYTNAPNRGEDHLALSSSVEWLAQVALRQPELDRVSLAELLLWDNITYPHTTRRGLIQAAPGSVHEVASKGERGCVLSSRQLWVPREPAGRVRKRDCVDAAVQGVEEASREIAGSASRAGVLLSGGLDSRIVAATLSRLTHVEAITYADRPNRESAAAARTASLLGICHHLVERDPQFYAHAFLEGQRLVGFEQNPVPCHSLCVAGRPELVGLDVVVGGFGCDILLKGAYIPYSMMEVLRGGTRRRSDNTKRIGKHNYGQAERRAPMIRAEYVRAARERRTAYESELRSIRPASAEEWAGFYPISHTTSIDSMAADRRMPHDEFYFRAGIVDVSIATPWAWKKGLDIMSAIGRRLARDVARLPHPDNGLPATWKYLPSRVVAKVYRAKAPRPTSTADGSPWASNGSFVNYGRFFEHAPAWRAVRDLAIADADAVGVLSEVVRVDVVRAFRRYVPECGSLMNAAVVHALRLIASARGGACAEPVTGCGRVAR